MINSHLNFTQKVWIMVKSSQIKNTEGSFKEVEKKIVKKVAFDFKVVGYKLTVAVGR